MTCNFTSLLKQWHWSNCTRWEEREIFSLLEAIFMVSKPNNHLQNLFEEFECRKASNFSTKQSNILITEIGHTCLTKPLSLLLLQFLECHVSRTSYINLKSTDLNKSNASILENTFYQQQVKSSQKPEKPFCSLQTQQYKLHQLHCMRKTSSKYKNNSTENTLKALSSVPKNLKNCPRLCTEGVVEDRRNTSLFFRVNSSKM